MSSIVGGVDHLIHRVIVNLSLDAVWVLKNIKIKFGTKGL